VCVCVCVMWGGMGGSRDTHPMRYVNKLNPKT